MADHPGVNELRIKAGDRDNEASEDLPGAGAHAGDDGAQLCETGQLVDKLWYGKRRQRHLNHRLNPSNHGRPKKAVFPFACGQNLDGPSPECPP